jgi:hypothetical protein
MVQQHADDRLGDDAAAHLAQSLVILADFGFLEHIEPQRRPVEESAHLHRLVHPGAVALLSSSRICGSAPVAAPTQPSICICWAWK